MATSQNKKRYFETLKRLLCTPSLLTQVSAYFANTTVEIYRIQYLKAYLKIFQLRKFAQITFLFRLMRMLFHINTLK